MKKLFIIVLLTMSAYSGYSQTDSIVIDSISKDTSGLNLHTLESLSPMKKVDLTTIYLNQVANLTDLLGKTSLKDGDVPTNRYLKAQWKAIDKASLRHNKVTLEKYKSIIPYSDRDEIINSILFLQEMILQMNSI